MAHAGILWNAKGSELAKLDIVRAKVYAIDPNIFIKLKIMYYICLYMFYIYYIYL